MKYRNRAYFVALFTLYLLLISFSVYSDGEKSWYISYPMPDSEMPILALVDIKAGVLIGPVVVRPSMTGTVRFVAPSGNPQTLSVNMGNGGFSRDLNLSEIGNYRIEESYTLKVDLSFGPVTIRSQSFSENHDWIYSNQVAGTKTFKVTSRLSYSGSNIQGPIEIYSVQPSVMEPGVGTASVMIRALSDIKKDEVFASSVTVSCLWDKISSIIMENSPPLVQINSATQVQANGDVQISFTLQDLENAACIIEVEYKKITDTLWKPATINNSLMTPGSRTVLWKAALDQPSGQGSYDVRMRASDGLAYSSWSSARTTLNNTTAVDNNPPLAYNVRIIILDGSTGQEVFRDPITGDKLKAAYEFDDIDGDLERNSVLRWYKNGILFPGEQSLTLSQSVRKGEKWRFTIAPGDGKITGPTQASADVTVGNAPPQVTSVRIEPAIPHSRDNLRAEYIYSDPENDPAGIHEIQWHKNGVHQPLYDGMNPLPWDATSKGDEWRFSIRPQDADGAYGEMKWSSTVSVVNQKPVVEIVSFSGERDNDGELTGDIKVTYNLKDDDGDTCKLIVWYQGGSVSRVKTPAYIVEATDPGREKNVITDITPANGLTVTWRSSGDEVARRSDDYRIGIIPYNVFPGGTTELGTEGMTEFFSLDNNKEPVATQVAVSPLSPFSSDVLKATYVFVDPDGDVESGSEIKWYKNGVEQTQYINRNELPNSATNRCESWSFKVRPKDGKEFGEEKTSPTVKISNSPPQATEVKLEPERAGSDDNLKAFYIYNDADGDLQTDVQIRWYLNNNMQAQYNNQTMVPASDTAKGQTWYFTIQVSDGTIISEIITSNSVSIGNVIPEVRSLIVPTEGFRDVTVKFDLVDADGDKCNLTVEYQGGLVSIWTPATIKEPLTEVSPGLITLTWESAKDVDVKNPAKFQIRVTPSDGLAAGVPVESTFITLDNNEPPVASNLKILPENPTAADNLIASYDYSDGDGGKESGSEIFWYVNDDQTSYTGKTLLASATLRGQSWHFTVRPRDGAKFGDLKASSPITIRNSPPMALNPAIIPAAAKAGDTLSVRYEYRDLDQDRESGTEIEWYKNGLLELRKTVSAEKDKDLPVAVSKGERWYAIIRPKDGSDFGEPVTSSIVSVGNAVPVIENVQVSIEAGSVIITYSLKDDDGDPCDLDVRYQGGSVGNVWTPATIKEPTTKVLPGSGLKLTWSAGSDEAGQSASNYRIKITPDDGVSAGQGVISNLFSISNNNLPTAVDILILPGAPVTSDPLQASYTFLDIDGDTEDKLKAIIRWYKNGNPEPLYDNIAVLPASATKKGDRWHYTISVSDGKDYSKTQLSPHVIIRNAPPSVKNVLLTPTHPDVGAQLLASYTYVDADGDSEVGTEIKWYRDGVHLPGYNNSSVIPGTVPRAAETWYFTVVPKDGFDFGIPETSNNVFIADMPPSASSLRILPANPLTTNALLASYIYIDPENDPEKGSKITWYKNSVAQPQYNDLLQLPSTATAKKQVWHFSVQPSDGKQFGSEQFSGFVVIGNTPPVAKDLSITPAYPLDNDDLVASYTYSDIDGDVEGRKTEINWYRNGVWTPDNSMKTLPNKATVNGERWYFTIRPNDGTDFGDIMISPEVEIGSPIPRVNNLTIMPRDPVTTDDLTVAYIYTDPNGIPESGSLITWYKNNVAQTEYSNSKVLPSDATSKDEQWYFSVRPSNGRDLGKEQLSAPVTILNSAPLLKDVMVKPTEPTTDESIIVSYVFDDADGDPESRNEIKWFRNGALQSGYNNVTELPASVTKRAEEWYFTIRSSDGVEFSGLATSTSVVIGNGVPKALNVKLLPNTPLTDSDLEVVYDFVDTESDPELGTEIRWFRDDVHQPDYDDLKFVPSEATERDENWYCTIMPRDGIDFGRLYTSPAVRIGNSAPVFLKIAPESDKVLRDRSVPINSNGEDADAVDSGPNLKCITQFRFGTGNWVDLPAEYVEDDSPHWMAVFTPGKTAQLGQYDFRTKFIDTAGAESNWLVRDKMLTVENNPPVIGVGTDVFRVPEDAIRQFDLRDHGSDVEDDNLLTWKLDATSVNTELFQAAISSDRFLEIRPMDNKNGSDDITLTLTDKDGAEVVKTDVTILVDPVNDAPTMPTSIGITPQSPRTSDNLICAVEGSTDVDGDEVVYRYQWFKDGVLQPGLNSPNVSYSRTLKGELWRCEVTPSDGISDGPPRSAELTIANTLPEVAIRKVAGNVNDITITFNLTDADADTCELKIEYRIKGQVWKPATIPASAGLPASSEGLVRDVKPGVDINLVWQSRLDEDGVVTDDCRLRITPNDGTTPATPKESESFLLDNKPPEFTVTSIANPVHSRYIDVTVVSDEKLVAAPVVSSISAPREGEASAEPLALNVRSIGDNIWTGKLVLEPGFDGSVLFAVEGVDLVGNTGKAELESEYEIPSAVSPPLEFSLGQNYPNPFSKDTNIPYELPESSNVVIEIYNTRGQIVRTLDEGYKVGDFYRSRGKAAYWDGRDDNGNMVASGVYYYYLKAGIFEGLRKMAVIR